MRATVRRLIGCQWPGVLVALALTVCSHATAAADACRVLDPELQGAYSGPCVDGLAQGRGEATGNARYVGDFVAGRKHGQGVKQWPSGDRYEGAFADDLRHGYGVYAWGARSKWPGERYTGSYVRDQRHGAGVYTWPDGRELAGQWRNDLPPQALPPVMQLTVRAYAERMAALSHPGAKVCRNVPVGTVQFDTVSAIVLGKTGDQLRLRITGLGKFSRQLDGREIAVGDEVEVEVEVEGWYACR